MPLRIVFLVHAHILESFGGTEHATFALHKHFYNENNGAIQSWVISAGEPSKSKPEKNDFRIKTESFQISLKGRSQDERDTQLEFILKEINPQIVHVHHYIHFGIDVIPALRKLCPTAKIVLTVHEFLLLCAHQGQMITRNSNKICTNPKPDQCIQCFPGNNKQEFEARIEATQQAIDACDGIISPSLFLMNVLRKHRKINQNTAIIENGLPPMALHNCNQSDQQLNNTKPKRFAFFGQISERKGILILLQACYILMRKEPNSFKLEINGGGLEKQPAFIQYRIHQLLKACEHHVFYNGKYKQDQITSLMSSCDWVVVPSIWWENSPVVIQEAFAHNRPVIGTDHGGIQEKIMGLGGLTFKNADPNALADCMLQASKSPELHQLLQQQIKQVSSAEQCANNHLDFYNTLLHQND